VHGEQFLSFNLDGEIARQKGAICLRVALRVTNRLAGVLAGSGQPHTVRPRKPIVPTRFPLHLETTDVAHSYPDLILCTQVQVGHISKVALDDVMVLFLVPCSIAFMVILCYVDQFLGGSTNVSVQPHTPLFLV
jgi:hypothetical protein